nr:hypothetical protein [Anaerolineae bacterium]
MPVFTFSFTVDAPLEKVAAFHSDTRALRRLTPPPVFVQLHDIEPPTEGSISRFTMWFGPFPVRWVAVHTGVGPNGFTDTLEDGLLETWRHTHRYTAEGPDRTLISEYIVYRHRRGWRGLISRLLFAPPMLWFLFTYRRWVTRRSLTTNPRTQCFAA